MIGAIVFCPSCSGRATTVIAVANRNRIVHVVACLDCSLVSEVGMTGQLIDLGHIDLDDLAGPTRDMFETPPILVTSPAPRLCRRES